MLNDYQSILEKHRNKSELTLAAEKDKAELEISKLKKDYEKRHNAVTDQYTFLLLNGVEKVYEDNEVILFQMKMYVDDDINIQNGNFCQKNYERHHQQKNKIEDKNKNKNENIKIFEIDVFSL